MIYYQKPIRGASHFHPYSSFVRQGKTEGLTVLLFPLECWRTAFILYSNSFPLVCPGCTSSMYQTCSSLSAVVLTLLGPLLLTLLIIGHDWCWGDKVVNLQGLLKFRCKQSKVTFHWLGITLLPFAIILPADSWQTQLCCCSSSCHVPSERRRGEGPEGVGEGLSPTKGSVAASSVFFPVP